MNKGKFYLTEGMLKNAPNLVKKLLDSVEILEVNRAGKRIEYIVTCDQFDQAYITLPIYEMCFNTSTCEIHFERMKL